MGDSPPPLKENDARPGRSASPVGGKAGVWRAPPEARLGDKQPRTGPRDTTGTPETHRQRRQVRSKIPADTDAAWLRTRQRHEACVLEAARGRAGPPGALGGAAHPGQAGLTFAACTPRPRPALRAHPGGWRRPQPAPRREPGRRAAAAAAAGGAARAGAQASPSFSAAARAAWQPAAPGSVQAPDRWRRAGEREGGGGGGGAGGGGKEGPAALTLQQRIRDGGAAGGARGLRGARGSAPAHGASGRDAPGCAQPSAAPPPTPRPVASAPPRLCASGCCSLAPRESGLGLAWGGLPRTRLPLCGPPARPSPHPAGAELLPVLGREP